MRLGVDVCLPGHRPDAACSASAVVADLPSVPMQPPRRLDARCYGMTTDLIRSPMQYNPEGSLESVPIRVCVPSVAPAGRR